MSTRQDTLMVSTFDKFLKSFLNCFTEASQQSFLLLAGAWVLCLGRRTVTGLIRTAGKAATKSHDAYQYFFSRAVWEMDSLWKILFGLICKFLIAEDAVIMLAGDDTLAHHTGRRIFGLGVFRDAVRSSKKKVAYAMGHNWVVLCVVIPLPFWEGRFLSLPVCARLRPKTKPKIKQGRKSKKKSSKKKPAAEEEATTVDLLDEMVVLVASWAPESSFQLVADGAYATLAGSMPENVSFVGRIRKDAAIYALAVAKKRNGRGRPPKKGKRLPTPEQTARRAKKKKWQRETFMLYGETVERLLYSFEALWYHVCSDQRVRIVCVRDLEGKQKDEFFFTTDLTLSPVEIVQLYGGRWSIEITFREVRQHLGLETPQARLQKAVERQAPFCLLIFSLVALWYVDCGHKHPASKHQTDPWYPHKEGVSFATMLSTLRVASWQDRIFNNSTFEPQQRKIIKLFLRAFSRSA